ncbi:MAG TPA: periplasmic heavy metal sensor [Pyrinomonadaceae bacterium]|jgi:Spy/CpxP family protein refolding chaperone
MKQLYNRVMMLLTVLAFATVPSVLGQAGQQAIQQTGQIAEPQQRPTDGDPIQQLNLTPEQREQIRSIRENNKSERMTISNRLRDANRALDEAMNADNPDEALVEQRLRDVAAAQAAASRLRILTEIRIRRVLSKEQRDTLRALQIQARQNRRERQMDNPEQRQQRVEQRRALQNQRNGLGPLLRRRENQRPRP